MRKRPRFISPVAPIVSDRPQAGGWPSRGRQTAALLALMRGYGLQNGYRSRPKQRLERARGAGHIYVRLYSACDHTAITQGPCRLGCSARVAAGVRPTRVLMIRTMLDELAARAPFRRGRHISRPERPAGLPLGFPSGICYNLVMSDPALSWDRRRISRRIPSLPALCGKQSRIGASNSRTSCSRVSLEALDPPALPCIQWPARINNSFFATLPRTGSMTWPQTRRSLSRVAAAVIVSARSSGAGGWQ